MTAASLPAVQPLQSGARDRKECGLEKPGRARNGQSPEMDRSLGQNCLTPLKNGEITVLAIPGRQFISTFPFPLFSGGVPSFWTCQSCLHHLLTSPEVADDNCRCGSCQGVLGPVVIPIR